MSDKPFIISFEQAVSVSELTLCLTKGFLFQSWKMYSFERKESVTQFDAVCANILDRCGADRTRN